MLSGCCNSCNAEALLENFELCVCKKQESSHGCCIFFVPAFAFCLFSSCHCQFPLHSALVLSGLLIVCAPCVRRGLFVYYERFVDVNKL